MTDKDETRDRDLTHTESSDRDEAEREIAEKVAATPDPHHELSNPVGEPDPTEWPDPYEKRPDPRDPAAVDTPAFPADPEKAAAADPAPADHSTSDPHPPRDHDVARREGVDR